MAQEEKQLLLKDLCARLPYGLKLRYVEDLVVKKESHIITLNTVYLEHILNGDADIKPYLRPMSSMTEEELKQFAVLKFQDDEIWEISDLSVINNDFVNVKCKHKNQEETKWTFQINKREMLKSWQGIDWLNAHHFDFRGLIPMGLALEAPEGMYK